MFWGCTSLNYIKCLAISGEWTQTSSWCKNVSSTGVFVKSKYATFWTNGDSGIPNNWTIETADSE